MTHPNDSRQGGNHLVYFTVVGVVLVSLIILVGTFIFVVVRQRVGYSGSEAAAPNTVAIPMDNGGFCTCPAEVDQVCGVDGITYSNTCEAGCYGADIKYIGVCTDEEGDSEEENFEEPVSSNFDFPPADQRVLMAGIANAAVTTLPANGSYQPSSCIPGAQAYWINDDGINTTEFIEGTLPFVFDLPHSGKVQPTTFGTRTQGSVLVGLDVNSREYGCRAVQEVRRLTGKLPSIIINHIYRSKLDANRNLAEACYPHVSTFNNNNPCHRAWKSFHDLIDYATQKVTDRYSRGHVFDIHTWGGEVGIYMGTDLSLSDLGRSDADLNADTYRRKSTQRNLAGILQNTLTDVTRSAKSLGGFLSSLGYPAFPSPQYPRQLPNGGTYPNGAYNVERHGSKQGGVIDATQIETQGSFIRDATTINSYGADLGQAVVRFVEEQYGFDLSGILPTSTLLPPTPTATPTPSRTPTPAPSSTGTATPSPTRIPLPTPTPTRTILPTLPPSQTLTPSPTLAAHPSLTPLTTQPITSSTIFFDTFESGNLSLWSTHGDVSVTDQESFIWSYALQSRMNGLVRYQLAVRKFDKNYSDVTLRMYIKFGFGLSVPEGEHLNFAQLQKFNPYVNLLSLRLAAKDARYYLSLRLSDDGGRVYNLPGTLTNGRDITDLVRSDKWYLFEITFRAGNGSNGLERLRVFDPRTSTQTPLFSIEKANLDINSLGVGSLMIGSWTTNQAATGTLYFDNVRMTTP